MAQVRVEHLSGFWPEPGLSETTDRFAPAPLSTPTPVLATRLHSRFPATAKCAPPITRAQPLECGDLAPRWHVLE